MDNGSTLMERLEFQVIAKKAALPGVDDAIRKFEKLALAVQNLNAAMAQQSSAAPMIWKKSATDIKAAIDYAQSKGHFGVGKTAAGSLKPEEMARVLGYDPAAVKNFMAQATAGLIGENKKQAARIASEARKTWDASAKQFRNVPGAAAGFSLYTKYGANQNDPRSMLLKALNPFYQSAQPPGAAAAAAAPVKNFAQRMAEAKAVKAAATATAGAPGGAAQSMTVHGGDSKAKELAKKRSQVELELSQALNAAQGANGQLTRKSVKKVVSAYQRAANQMRGVVGEDDSTGGKKALTTAEGWERKAKDISQKNARDQVAFASKQMEADKTDLAQKQKRREQQQKAAEKAQREADKAREQESRAALDPQHLAYLNRTRKEDETRQARIDQRLAHDRERDKQHGIAKAREAELQTRGAKVVGRGTGDKPQTTYEWDENGVRMRERISYNKSGAKSSMQVMAPQKAASSRWDKAVSGLTLPNMGANLLKFAEWSAAAGVLWKGFELAEYSLKRLIDTGNQTAHLSLVFRGMGGEVKALTSDIIGLAAQQGRSTDEALESATAWARLGGDRKTINEEVRVSAQAANIANLHMSETTRELQAIMHVYNLEAGDLQGTLGGLVNTSLRVNSTLDELFRGLNNSSAAAKVAGVGFAELQSMIGVLVGSTGQTGSMVGSSLKYVFSEISKPDIQKKLRAYGVEALGNNLEMKSGTQILGEISGKWGTLGPAAQQQLSTLLGGRFNASRIPIILSKMPEILNLAIGAQLHLNAAQEANVKILETMKAQLAGLKTAYDRLLVNGGSLTDWTQKTRVAKNILNQLAGGDKPSIALNPATASTKDLSDALRDEKKSNSGNGGKYNPDSVQSMKNELARRLVAQDKKAGKGFLSFDAEAKGTGVGFWDRYIAWSEYNPTLPGQEDFSSKLSDLKAKSAASGLRVLQFSGAIERLRNHSLTAGDANLYAESMQDMKGGLTPAFLNARKSGDDGAALAIAERARDQAYREQQDQLLAKSNLIKQNHDELQSKSDTLNQNIGNMTAGGVSQTDDKMVKAKNELQEVTKALEENKQAANDTSAAYEEVVGEIDNAREAMAQFGGLIKAQEALMTQLEQWQNATPAATPFQALAREAAVAQDQIEMLTAAQKEFNDEHANEPTKHSVIGVNDKFNELLQDAQNRLDAAKDPVRNQMARKLTEQQGGKWDAQNFATENDFGIDNAGKDLNRLRALQADRARTLAQLAQSPGNGELAGRMGQEDIDIWQTKLDLAKRFSEVNKEIRQLTIDTQKEFVRSVYGSGPAEMLQRLAAFRMAFNGNGTRKSPLSQGAFFGLSLDMRNDYGMLQPDLDPRMIELKNERSRINRSQNEWRNPQAPGVMPGSGMASAIQQWDALKKMGGNAADVLTDVANGLRSSGNSLVMVVANLAKRLADAVPGTPTPGVVTNGHLPANPQSGGVGGAKGFTMPHISHGYPGVRTF